MSKRLKIATVGVAVFAGLLVAYLAGYETAKTTDLNTATAQVTPNPKHRPGANHTAAIQRENSERKARPFCMGKGIQQL